MVAVVVAVVVVAGAQETTTEAGAQTRIPSRFRRAQPNRYDETSWLSRGKSPSTQPNRFQTGRLEVNYLLRPRRQHNRVDLRSNKPADSRRNPFSKPWTASALLIFPP